MKKVIDFVNKLEKLYSAIEDKNLDRFIEEARDFIEKNEFELALEILLENIYEFEISLNPELLENAKEALDAMNMSWGKWQFIEELLVLK